jgi:hypothetical protein
VRWARLLDSVILLDAGDRLVASRIRTRAKQHRIQRGSDGAIRRFADNFRQAFDTVIADLARSGRLVVDEIRTDGPLTQNTARLRAALARHRHDH